MSKKILAALLSVLIISAVLSGCNTAENKKERATVVDSQGNVGYVVTDKDGKAVTKNVTDKNGKNVTDKNGIQVTEYVTEPYGGKGGNADKTTSKKSTSKKTTTTKKSEDVPKGWKKGDSSNEITNGKVTANVIRDDSASTKDGYEMISELIKGALSGGKIISEKQDKSQVIVLASGTRTTGGYDKMEFFKFHYIIKDNGSYLITYFASSQEALESDFSEVVKMCDKIAG